MKYFAPLAALAVLLAFAVVPNAIQAQTTSPTTSITQTVNQLPGIINSLGGTVNAIIQACTSQQGLQTLIRNIGYSGTVFLNSMLNSGLEIVNYVLYAFVVGLLFPIPLVGWLCTVPVTGIVALLVEIVIILADTLQALLRSY